MKTDKEWEERARELLIRNHILEASLQLGREMADERAEEIARMCEHYLSDAESIQGTTSVGMIPGLKSAANLARSTITPRRPKAREQVLEEALREIASKPFDPFSPERAKAALEWRSQ